MLRSIVTIGALLLISSPARGATRLKDMVDVQGMRENELFGYGLVVGLSGTGDTEQVLFTSQSISGMLGRLGIRVNPKDVRSRNVAAVMVTAKLPTYSRAGSRVDVSVSSMGNARSLEGGVLLVTPLTGADGAVYALAQGALQLGGFEVGSAGSYVRKNQTTTGRVPAGATVEKAVTPKALEGTLLISLRRPDFTNASRVVQVLNTTLGEGAAKALDAAAVEITIPESFKGNTVGLLAKMEELEVEADSRAKVVVNERTGTVVVGETVRLRPAAVAHGGLRVSVSTAPVISQPQAPFSNSGRTVTGAVSQIDAQESSRTAVALPSAASVDELVKALNLLGASPRDLIAILQALKAAGSLDAELEVI